MVTREEYMPENIIINHEIEEETNLHFSDLVFNDDTNIKLKGNITCDGNDMGKPIIIGAYTVKNDEILEISANTFKIKNITSSFKLEFDKNDIDTLYVYADFLTTKSANTTKTTYNNQNTQRGSTSHNFNTIDRLKNSIDIDYNLLKKNGLRIENLGVERDDDDSLNVYAEIHSISDRLRNNISIHTVLYDKDNNILDESSVYLYSNTFYKYSIKSWYFYSVKLARIDRIKIYSQLL